MTHQELLEGEHDQGPDQTSGEKLDGAGWGEKQDGFVKGFGTELALTGLGEIEDGFDSRIGAELGETGRDRASATLHGGPGQRSPEQGMS